jgi:hypothetical protein
LTLLAPDIIEAVLGGRQPAEMTLGLLMKPFAVEWTEQRIQIFAPETGVSVKRPERILITSPGFERGNSSA